MNNSVSNLNLSHKIDFVAAFDTVAGLQGWWEKNSETIVGLAVTGRSNVGKSSLINALYKTKVANTSKTPGRTQAVNIFRFFLRQNEVQDGVEVVTERACYLFDLPGHGYAQVSKEMKLNWEKLMSSFFELTSHKLCFLQIQDARHPHTPTDEIFNSFFGPMGCYSFLIFNKMDKLKTQKERALLNNKKVELCKLYPWVKQIHFVSSVTQDGLDELKLSITSYLWQRLLS